MNAGLMENIVTLIGQPAFGTQPRFPAMVLLSHQYICLAQQNYIKLISYTREFIYNSFYLRVHEYVCVHVVYSVCTVRAGCESTWLATKP